MKRIAHLCPGRRFAAVSAAYATRAAEPVANSLTIYSTAQPGAVPPEMYRNGGHPGTPCPATRWCATSARSSSRPGRNDGALHRRRRADRSDHRVVRVAHRSDRHARGRAELPVRPGEHRQAAAEVHRPRHHRRAGARREGRDLHAARCCRLPAGWCCARTTASVRVVSHNSGITLPSLPGGLITRPTLVWDVAAGKSGQAPGARRRTRPRASRGGPTTTSPTPRAATPTRASSTSAPGSASSISPARRYPDAKIKLIAGDVHRRRPRRLPPRMLAKRRMAEAMRRTRSTGFEEKTFFEYHLYTLGRPSTLPDNSTKQIELFPSATGVPARRRWSTTARPACTAASAAARTPTATTASPATRRSTPTCSFKNAQENGMGMPMPAGPRAREQAGHGRRLARVHRRGPHRPHAQEREGAAQARLRVRRRRRAQAGRLQDRHRRATP